MIQQQTQQPVEGNGYFLNRIRSYLHDYHPDLLENEDSESMISTLAQEAAILFQAYDRQGMPIYEALERALTDTLEAITSSYSTLRDFVLEQAPLLSYLTNQKELAEPEWLRALLDKHRVHVKALMDSSTPEDIETARKSLLRELKKTLLDMPIPYH